MARPIPSGHMRLSLASSVLILMVMVSTVVAKDFCPPDWVEYSYSCMYFNPTPLTFAQADAACEAVVPGAHLAVPRDTDENNAFNNLRQNGQSAWLGVNSLTTSNWVSMAGSSLPFTLWAAGQPSPNGIGNCALLHPTSWQWVTAGCTALYPSVCRFYPYFSSINPEMLVVNNRLHGATDWLGTRNGWWAFEDGEYFNATLTQGPTGLPDSAIQLNQGTESYIAFTKATDPGVNYLHRDFYFMFYVYLTASSVGPILQYRFNETSYGFNIWSYGNGSLLIDLVPATLYGPVPNPTYQVFVPASCIPLNQWAFITINYWYGNNGNLFVWQGTNNTQCVQVALGSFDIEMSRGFDIGRRQTSSNSSIYAPMKIGCMVSGELAPVSQFLIGETALWCKQAMQETFMDRSVARRAGISFAREDTLVGMWPLNDFYRTRDAVGRIYYGRISNNSFQFGPQGQVNSSLYFDGVTTFVSLNDQPNQVPLGASFNMLRRSFTISAYIFTRGTGTDGGPFVSFASDKYQPWLTTTIFVHGGSNVEVVMPLLGGNQAFTAKTFAGCLTAGTWMFLSVVYDYQNGQLSVYHDGVPCGSTQNIGQGDIEAHTNIIVGRTSSGSTSPPAFFRGKISCFSLHLTALTTAEMLAAIQTCKDVQSTGRVFDGYIYKPQHLRLFLPLGRKHGTLDMSGRNMHGTTRGRLGTSTGPLGHAYSATRFYNQPRSGIDIGFQENQFSIGSNDSVTYMGYTFVQPNRDGNLEWGWQMIFEHHDLIPGGGWGFQFLYYTMGQLYYAPTTKGRNYASNFRDLNGLNMFQWRWYVVRYSRLTRKFSITIDGVPYADDTFGRMIINTYSSMTLGYRVTDDTRLTGKLSCFMMYDTDLRDDEIKHAKDMCHSALIEAYGPPIDNTMCKHTQGGYEYRGNVAVTRTGRFCAPWTSQNSYTDPNSFPDKNLVAAGSYCRNPEFDMNVRSAPWCFTQDLNVTWEYCAIPTCPQRKLAPFHKPQNVLGFWPLSKTYGGMDASGHDSHGGVGDVTWVTGPSGLPNTATYFKDTSSGHIWLQTHEHNNLWHLLDLGYKTPWLDGYSYHVFAQFTTSYAGGGWFWSWETSNGEGGSNGIGLHFVGSDTVEALLVDYRYWGSLTISCNGLTNGQWYQFTLVYNRAVSEVQMYRDSVLCTRWNWNSWGWWFYNDGLATYTGSFKFGRQQGQVGSKTSIACAAIYTVPLTGWDLAIIRQKCLDMLAGDFDVYALEPALPLSQWQMSAQTEGLNSRGPQHARFAMAEPTDSPFGVPQGALAFPGNNLQYFFASQDYNSNFGSKFDACSQTKSFSMSAYAYVPLGGTFYAFQSSSGMYDDTSLLGRGNAMYLVNSSTVRNGQDLFFSMTDNGYTANPSKSNATVVGTWTHIAISYDLASDTFFTFINGSLVYRQNPLSFNPSIPGRGYYCQTSGSMMLGRSAARPLTLGTVPANPMQGSLQCAQIHNRAFQSELSVQRAMKACSHPDFVGCYPGHIAGSTDFRFNPGFWANDTLTIANCRLQCGRASYQYAALRKGSICLCGNTYGSDGVESPENCIYACSGNKGDLCGGDYHYSVYRSTQSRVAISPNIRMLDYANCLPNWYLRGSYCYRVFTNRYNFADAQASCASFGAQLASVADFDENNFILGIAPSAATSGENICLGINATVGLQYKGTNMDGTPFFFANWATNQPSADNSWGCVIMSSKLWYSKPLTDPFFYACKKPVVPYSDASTRTGCLPGWSRFENDCYIFRPDLLPYGTAQKTCSNYVPQSYLPKITSFSQLMFIVNITDLQHSFWLGLEYLPPSGVGGDFTWASDATLLAKNFSFWAGDHRMDTTTRRCVYSDSRSQYGWRTGECSGAPRLAFVCQYPLQTGPGLIGLGSAHVIDSQIYASGVVSSSTPPLARLNNPDGAFCPDPSNVPGAYLYIDFRSFYSVWELWMQGSPTSAEWTKEITVDYSQDGGVTWIPYKFTSANYYSASAWTTVTASPATPLIPGNINQGSLMKHVFATPLVANKLRIAPTQYNSRPCMRLELYGQALNNSMLPPVDIAFKPIIFELTRISGMSVRYNASAYTWDKNIRVVPFGSTERVTGLQYVYRPRLFGRQRINFAGIDAEGNTHEMSYDLYTATKSRSILLNMCPVAIRFGDYAACEVRITGGSDIVVTTNYGFEIRGPRRLVATRVEIGSIVPPSSTNGAESAGTVYLQVNQVAKMNTTVFAIEAIITQPGWVTVQVWKPACVTAGTYFCPVCHCCLYTNITCPLQHTFDSYSCTTGYTKDNSLSCSIAGMDGAQQRTGYFVNSGPKVDYLWVAEWRKYFTATGAQVAYLDDTEVMEISIGWIVGYSRNTLDDGRIQTYSTTNFKEYTFNSDITSGYSIRQQTLFSLSVSRAVTMMSPTMHMLKLVGTSSIGVSFGRKWAQTAEGIQTIIISSYDRLFPDNILIYTHQIDVQYMCIGYQLVYPAYADATTFVPFLVPPHNGSKCQYSLDFGDGSNPTMFDYKARNSTFYHVYKLDGVYNVTITVWNLIYSSSVWYPITVVFPIQRMSTYIANQPATLVGHYSTTVVSFAQASSVTTITNVDANNTKTGGTFVTKSFSVCPNGWVSGTVILGVDNCYRFFQTTLDYSTAESFCASMAGSLVHVTSSAELDFVKNVMAGGVIDKGAWTGYSQLRDDFQMWVAQEDKRALPAPVWQETSDVYPIPGAGACAYYDYASRRLQNDMCTVARPFVCKREISIATFCGPVPGWTYHAASNRCFKVVTTLSSYVTAVTTCRHLGGNLVVPESNSTFNFVYNLAKKANPTISYYMSIWRTSGTNTWRVFDGTDEFIPPFTNYDSGHPTAGQGENCLVMLGSTGRWRTVTCSDMDGYVCEKPISGTKGKRYVARTASRRYVMSSVSAPSCPLGWKLNPTSNMCYRVMTEAPMTWQNAENDCFARFSSHLATVNTAADQSFFTSSVIVGYSMDFWIGYAQTGAASWVWTDGTDPATGTTAWASSQPGYAGNGYAFYVANSAVWTEDSGSSSKAYVCSKPATVDPKIWAGTCPSGYQEFAGRCFKFYSTVYTLTAGLTKCRSDGGNMATIQSYEDWVFIRGMLPPTIGQAWVGLQTSGSTWQWTADVRLKRPAVTYTGMWATSQPGATTGCAYISRPNNLALMATSSCGTTYPIICEQPAAVCPGGWTIFAGTCYRAFTTEMHVSPGPPDYDTATGACQYGDSLPLSPVVSEELALAKLLAGATSRFGLGYRRLSTSTGYIDLSGRPSFFARQSGEPTSSNYYAFFTGSGTSVSYTWDLWPEATVCQSPSKLNVESCLRRCLSTTEFQCLSFMFDGRTCKFMSVDPSSNWYGLRDSFGSIDTYSVRRDLCPPDLVRDATTIQSSLMTASATQVTFTGANDGFSPVNETTDLLTIDFGNSVWLSGLVIGKRVSVNEYVKTFALSYSFDRSDWYTYQYPAGTNYIFTGNSDDNPVVVVNLPKPILVKTIQLIPLTYFGMPSYRLKAIGCHGAIFVDYVDYLYNKPGDYSVQVSAYSPSNNVSVGALPIYVQSKLTSATIPPIPALPYGDWAVVPFDYTEDVLSANPVANGTFNLSPINNITIAWTSKHGQALIAPNQYTGIGYFPMNLSIDNYVSDPIDLKTTLWVDFPVMNLTVATNATALHGTLVRQTIEVYVTMANCSRCNVTVSYGAIDAVPTSYFQEFSFIPADTIIATIPSVYYPTIGGYFIAVSAKNFLPVTKTVVYDIYVQKLPLSQLFTYVVSSPNKIPYRGFANVTYQYWFSGLVNDWPTNASMYIEFGDGANMTAFFDATKLPPAATTPVVANRTMAIVPHLMNKPGTYTAFMQVWNRVGSCNTTLTFDVDEELVGLAIKPSSYYITPGTKVTFNVTKAFGTRFTWLATIPLPDGTFVYIGPNDGNVTSFDFTFDQVGAYLPFINGSNAISVSPNNPLPSCCPIIVMWPVLQARFKLKLEKPTDKLAFDNENDNTGHAKMVLQLWMDPRVQEPSAPYFVLYFNDKDGTQSVNTSLQCNPNLATTTDGPWVMCLVFQFVYQEAGAFNIVMNVSNLVSLQSFTTQYVVYVSIPKVYIYTSYWENEAAIPSWRAGFPPIDSIMYAKDPKFPYQMFFPVGKPIQFKAATKFPDGIQYCFFNSYEGNMTDCSGPWHATNRTIVKTFNYDTPCPANPSTGKILLDGDCGMKITVVASNPVDTATGTLTIYLQKPTTNPKLIQGGPIPENSTFPLNITFDQFATDACIEVDYGTTKLSGTPTAVDGTSQSKLYGAEYVCAYLYYDQPALLQTLKKPVSGAQIQDKGIPIDATYYKFGPYKVTARIKNFVDQKNEKTSPALSQSIIVTRGPCNIPQAYITLAKTTSYKKDELIIPGQVFINCSSSSAVSVNWTMLYRPDVASTWKNVGSNYHPVSRLILNLKGSKSMPALQDVPLNFSGTLLPYGFYQFVLNASMVEEFGLFSTASFNIEVIKSELVAGLTPPGTRRDLVFRDQIKLNAFDMSYDPDIGGRTGSKDGMQVYYFCKRDCEGDWPAFTTFQQIQFFVKNASGYAKAYGFTWGTCKTDDDSLKSDMYESNGCFVSAYHLRRTPEDPDLTYGFPSLNPKNFTRKVAQLYCGNNATSDCTITLSKVDDNRTLTIDSSYQFENQTYNLMAIVIKDTRYAIARQAYRLERGAAPQALVTVVTNCIYPHGEYVTFNPTSRASFHGLITDRIPGRQYFFDWRLIAPPPSISISTIMDNIEDSANNYTWPYQYWLNQTSTGNKSDDLSLNANLFGRSEYNRYFVAFVAVTRSGNPRRGISSLGFFVNTPPNASNVTCRSNVIDGIALNTLFKFNCTGFYSPYGPLSRFVFSMQTCSYCQLVVLTPTIGSPVLMSGLKLPPGIANQNYMVTIYVDAYDKYDSITRVKFQVRVRPDIDLNTAVSLSLSYKTAVTTMSTETLCQVMFTFASALNEVYLEPIYAYNQTAYNNMNAAKKKKEDEKVAEDTIRYNKQLQQLKNIRFNITQWLLTSIDTKGIKQDPNSVRTCCSVIASNNYIPEQSSESRTLANTLTIMQDLANVLAAIGRDPNRDADRLDEATSTCFGAAGTTSNSLEKNVITIKVIADKKLGDNNSDNSDEDDSGENNHRRKKRGSGTSQPDAYGSLSDAQLRARVMQEILDLLHEVVLSAKVLKESSSIISGPGMTSSLQKQFIGEMSNATLSSGSPDDCGSFTLGDASTMFAAADPLAGKNDSASDALSPEKRLKNIDITIKASMQSGNPYVFDSSAKGFNSMVQSLLVTNSSGFEIPVTNLPFEIEIMIESKNPQTPDQTSLRSLSAPYSRGLKPMLLNVSSLQALFINVERWHVPNLCKNRNISDEDRVMNLTCAGNVTTLVYDFVNYTLPALNISDDDVIFFVYAKFNDTPSEVNFDFNCILPARSFDDEYAYAAGYGPMPQSSYDPTTTTSATTVGSSTTTSATTTTTTKQPSTTPSSLNLPICSSLKVMNVTCCNGTLLSDGHCDGHFYIPTTAAPLTVTSSGPVKKDCSRPDTPNPNTCFFDHRIVNVTGDPKLLKVGVRAIPRLALRAFLHSYVANSTKKSNSTFESCRNSSVRSAALVSQSVRVGYIYSAYTSSCKFYDPVTKTWSSEGCRVGPLTTAGGNPSMTQCLCNHLTTFASSFDVPMNTFDPKDSAFTHLDQNPVCFAFGICILCCFFTLLIWARKRDKEDERKWGTIPLADNDPRDKYAYEITVWTGQRAYSGTSARVSFVLIGDEGETTTHLLEDDEREVLQRGAIDSFLLLTPRSIGKLVQLRIWHDNSGRHPNWYFSRMQVHDLQRNRQYYFLCDRWLAIDEDDGMVERALPVAGKKELAGFEHIFFTKSHRKLTDGHIWISVFSRPPLSKFTRCQRLTCCIAILYCTMLANIMFYGQNRDPPGTTRVEFGPFSMSTTKIFMSIVSTLIVLPMNLLIAQLFRLSKHRPSKQEKKMEELRTKAIKAQQEEVKKKIAAGAAAPPAHVGVTTVTSYGAVSGTEKGTTIETKRSKKAKKQKKPFKLPWWCIIVAYCLAVATCGVAFWAIVEFGGALGPDRATEWVISMIISLVTDILCVQPLKIIVLALFYALIIKSPTNDEDIQEKAALKDDEMFVHNIPTEAEIEERRKNREEDKRDYVFLPPDPEELKRAREVRFKEQKMWKILKEIAFYMFYLYLLLLIAYGTQDDWAMQLQKQMRRVYKSAALATPPYNASNPIEIANYNPKFDSHDEIFDNMNQEDQFFTYLERTLIPSVLDNNWYNGRVDQGNDIFTKDQTLFLVGSMRIRQLRVGTDSCRVARSMRGAINIQCQAPYSIFNEETRNYTAGWNLAPKSNTTFNKRGEPITMGDARGFAYKSEIDDRGLPFQAALTTYNGGGYIVDLGKKVDSAISKVRWLKANRWIDERTRAVFMEFNLYCPSRNLFAISQTVVEFFEGGSTVLYPYFYVTKLDPYYGAFALVILAFEFITLAVTIWLFVREVRLAIKYKRQYWKDWWAILEFTHLISCLIMAVMFMVRYAMARFVVGDNYKKTHKNTYTNFTLFITYDQLVQSFMGFVIFVAFIRMIRLLRFNRRLVIMITTLKYCRQMLISFFVVFFTVYLAFAQLGYLGLGSKSSAFASFVTSLETLFNMLLGVYDYKGMTDANRYLGPFLFAFFSLFINIFLVNAFVALLISSYQEVRADDAKVGNEHEMFDFIMNKFKAFLGLAPKRPNTLSVDKRFAYLDAAMHEDEIDKFTSRMDELMTKLDKHLEKTKSQFAGMFDQAYLNRKRREIYVTD